jgi:hypothetical protein
MDGDKREQRDQFVQPGAEIISWTASEYIMHKKGREWYMAYAGVTLVSAALIYLVTRDEISSGFVVIAMALFAVIAARPPRELDYALTENGIKIGLRFYLYGQFKSFSLVDEGALSSITLLPLRRFSQAITIYYDPTDEEQIVGVLTHFLPMEHRKLDLIERLMRNARF